MKAERYTEQARIIIEAAQARAIAAGHQYLTSEHVLTELLNDKEGLGAKLIRAANANVESVFEAAKAAISRLPRVDGGGAGEAQLFLAPEMERVFKLGEELADQRAAPPDRSLKHLAPGVYLEQKIFRP